MMRKYRLYLLSVKKISYAKKFRGRIDNIDRKVLELLNQRANIAKSVAEYKKSSNNRNIFRPDRESQIIKNLRSLNKGR